MTSELLTVVIPTRNRPDYLELSLRSVIERQDSVPRIIVSDNSSRDLPEMEMLRRKYEFSYVRQPAELNMVSHHNACLALPTTPWAFLLHDDDELSPNIVAKIESSLANAGDAGALIGGIEYINENGEGIGEWLPDRDGRFSGEEIVLHLGLDYRVCPPGILWNLSACRELGGFASANGVANEQVLLLRLAFARGVVLFPELMGRYRIWTNQTTSYASPKGAEYILDCTIQGTNEIPKIGISAQAADQLVDYMIWWVFRICAPLFTKHPFFVSRLCRKCELATPPEGPWRRRVRSEYPFLFWKPRGLCVLFVALALTCVPAQVRRPISRCGRAVYRQLRLLPRYVQKVTR